MHTAPLDPTPKLERNRVMASVTTPTQTRKTVVFYASLDDQVGVAMRTTDDVVCFRYEGTALWLTLTDADAPRLVLSGLRELADSQMSIDGDRVRRCSRTLVEV
jgi:hypothetical protein